MIRLFLTFVRKEFAHVLRDRKTLLILFGMPLVQILIFGFALSNEVKNARIAVLDYARDEASHGLLSKIEASRYFEIDASLASAKEIEAAFKKGVIKGSLQIPAEFQHDLLHEGKASVQLITDASDPNLATTITNYMAAIVSDYQAGFSKLSNSGQGGINVELRMLYNPQLKGVHNFVPGVMALVLMLVCVMMTAISIVREKESGTMEVLLVSPFHPSLVIFSKAIPYLILSLINVCTILLLSTLVLDLPINGNLLLLFAESALFIIACLSLGMLISVKTETQQAAMLISLLGMLLPTLLFSGFMFPIENMPKPLQLISNLVPARWFYIIVKAVMIKGLGFSGIWKETLILCGFAMVFLLLSIRNFKVRLA